MPRKKYWRMARSKSNPVVKGSFSQSDSRFLQNSGNQCMANSLIALVHSKSKNVSGWLPSDIDDILIHGDDLYSSICHSLQS